jgi:hypothetical protein
MALVVPPMFSDYKSRYENKRYTVLGYIPTANMK